MQTLPQEIINYVFSYLTVEESVQIMRLCRTFNYAGIDRLQRVLRLNGVTNTNQITTLSGARRALTTPLNRRITDLYCVISDLENFFRGEDWNISPIGQALISGSPYGNPTYLTNFLPSTIAPNSPARANTHMTTLTSDLVLNIRGESFHVGDYLRYRGENNRPVEYTEIVNARELLTALRDLIAWLNTHRARFLVLPDGTRLA